MGATACDSCGARFPVEALTKDDRDALHDQHRQKEFAEELRMLRKVQEFYYRRPDAEGRIKPHHARVMESKDRKVQDRLLAGVPFDEIELPPESFLEGVCGEDREVVEYLLRHSFSLRPRLKFVATQVVQLQRSAGAVECPACGAGRLHVPPLDWEAFIASDVHIWYRPQWIHVDADGALHVRTSWWDRESHSTGETTIGPESPDYDFWRWLAAQKEHHRTIKESELPTLREEWSRRTGRGA